MKGRFWVFEGMDGAGKSTQAGLLFDYLKAEGRNPLHVREPGTTNLGELLRKLLLDVDREDWHPRSEALLFFTARNELLYRQVLPELEGGRDVICERFTPSTLAYQAHSEEDIAFVLGVHNLVVGDAFEPDGVFILDCSPETSFERVARGDLDGFEKRGLEFQRLVRSGYHKFASQYPEVSFILDSDKFTIEEIHEQLVKLVGGYGSHN
jgi:dTMP kinase